MRRNVLNLHGPVERDFVERTQATAGASEVGHGDVAVIEKMLEVEKVFKAASDAIAQVAMSMGGFPDTKKLNAAKETRSKGLKELGMQSVKVGKEEVIFLLEDSALFGGDGSKASK